MTHPEGQTVADHDDWDRHWSSLNEVTGLNPAQHYRHQLLRRLVLRELRAHDSVQTVIDFGSGQGDLIRLIAPVIGNRRVVGLELSRVGVEIASAKTPGAIFRQVDLITDVPEYPDLYGEGGLCICAEVLEHIDDADLFLRNARRYMAPGGLLIITVPSGPMNAFEKSIGHRRHFRPDTISQAVVHAGLRVLKFERAGFPFFNLYKLVGYLMGAKIRADAETTSRGTGPSNIMKMALKAFDFLFRLNLEDTPFGWQLVVVAQNPFE